MQQQKKGVDDPLQDEDKGMVSQVPSDSSK